jgi:hypothetical protein
LGDLAPPVPAEKEGKEMREIPERCQAFRDEILGNRELLGELSGAIAEVLGKHDVQVAEDETYVFEPHLYVKPSFLPQVFAGGIPQPDPIPDPSTGAIINILDPRKGIPNPAIIAALERYRISERVGVGDIREQIVGNKALYNELGERIATILEGYGVKLQDNEAYLFVPYTFKKPVFTQDVFPRAMSVNLFRVADVPIPIWHPTVADDPVPIHPVADVPIPLVIERFSPRILAAAQPLSYWMPPRPLPGLIDWRRPLIGIPAPDILEHLEQLRVG